MKKSLIKLRQKLESAGFKVSDIRYVGWGNKLLAIGFEARNLITDAMVEVEPKPNSEWFVCFNNPPKSPMHYAQKRDGFMPTLCKEYKYLEKDILEHLQNEKN